MTDRHNQSEPAEPLSPHEAALRSHPDLVARIEADLAEPARLVTSTARRPRRDAGSSTGR